MRVVIFNSFYIGKNRLGKAVFAARSFQPRDIIVEFTGEIHHRDSIPKTYAGEDDRYFQVGVHRFMGASNTVDDLMNHSCDPNGGLKFTEYGIFLIALKPIMVGDEITWDYSTTMYKNDWSMRCRCGSEICRKRVEEFLELPRERQEYYLKHGVVAPYITRALRRMKKKAERTDSPQVSAIRKRGRATIRA